nr:hypothetical protein CFP56_64577 [Quercus suber]
MTKRRRRSNFTITKEHEFAMLDLVPRQSSTSSSIPAACTPYAMYMLNSTVDIRRSFPSHNGTGACAMRVEFQLVGVRRLDSRLSAAELMVTARGPWRRSGQSGVLWSCEIFRARTGEMLHGGGAPAAPLGCLQPRCMQYAMPAAASVDARPTTHPLTPPLQKLLPVHVLIMNRLALRWIGGVPETALRVLGTEHGTTSHRNNLTLPGVWLCCSSSLWWALSGGLYQDSHDQMLATMSWEPDETGLMIVSISRYSTDYSTVVLYSEPNARALGQRAACRYCSGSAAGERTCKVSRRLKVQSSKAGIQQTVNFVSTPALARSLHKLIRHTGTRPATSARSLHFQSWMISGKNLDRDFHFSSSHFRPFPDVSPRSSTRVWT